jgi:hypothetical protein
MIIAKMAMCWLVDTPTVIAAEFFMERSASPLWLSVPQTVPLFAECRDLAWANGAIAGRNVYNAAMVPKGNVFPTDLPFDGGQTLRLVVRGKRDWWYHGRVVTQYMLRTSQQDSSLVAMDLYSNEMDLLFRGLPADQLSSFF